jgi:hypothetical protein
MGKYAHIIAIFLCWTVVLTLSASAQNPNEKYLTAGDVEKATGIKGIALVPRGSVAGAGGDLNFADASGELILMVQFTEASNYSGFKNKYAKSSVSGIGEQAFEGAAMPGMPDNLVAFTKGNRCVVLTAFADFIKKKVYLTVDQLVALGKAIASRL